MYLLYTFHFSKDNITVASSVTLSLNGREAARPEVILFLKTSLLLLGKVKLFLCQLVVGR